jgi:hypothetical protein
LYLLTFKKYYCQYIFTKIRAKPAFPAGCIRRHRRLMACSERHAVGRSTRANMSIPARQFPIDEKRRFHFGEIHGVQTLAGLIPNIRYLPDRR